MGALYPDTVKKIIKDEMAAAGLTSDDLRGLIRKLESPVGMQ